MKSVNYNNAAWFYDRLAGLIFGRALINAQIYLLQFIPADARILIVGGGTGWVLEEIVKIYPAGLTITYVEVSANMVARSKKRDIGKNRVLFINDAIENLCLTTDFDVVLTPFLFDNFNEETLNKVFSHMEKAIKPGALWLIADFQLSGKWWQYFILKGMFLFFRILCNVEAKRLPDIEACYTKYNYFTADQKTFFNDFIISKVYKKSILP